MSDPLRYTRAGGPAYSPTTMVGTTTRWLRASAANAAPPLCVAWDTLVVLTADAEVSCAWTMTTTITLGAQDAYTSSYLTDNYGPDGDAAVDRLPAAGLLDTMPQLATVRTQPGARVGVCSGSVSYGSNLRPVYPPCRVDGDCTDAGASGTCNTSPSDAQILRSCAFAVCRASAAGTQVTAKLGR